MKHRKTISSDIGFKLKALGLAPSSIINSTDGGMVIIIRSSEKEYAAIECLYDGSLFAEYSNRKGDFKSWKLEQTDESLKQTVDLFKGLLK